MADQSRTDQSAPLLSVVTVCLNRAGTIAAALDSVARQWSDDIEHLVIDGGSTDGTLGIVAGYARVRVVSEPDTGLYDAMNKGVRLARGRTIVLLNSDDELADGVIAAVRPLLQAGNDVVCTGTDFVRARPDGSREVIDSLTAPDAIVLSPTTATLGSPLLNAKFIRRDFLRDTVGPFDLGFRIASDVDLLLRAALARPRVAVLPIVGHHYLEHGGSLTINPAGNNARRAAEECLAIADKALARRQTAGPGQHRSTRRQGGWPLAAGRGRRRRRRLLWLLPGATQAAHAGAAVRRQPAVVMEFCSIPPGVR